MRHPLLKPLPIVVGVAAGVGAYHFLYWLLVVNSSDVAFLYGHRSGYLKFLKLLEKVLFLPTIWVTKPLASIAWERGWLDLMTLAEVSLLSAAYGMMAALTVARQWTWGLQLVRRARWWLAGVFAILVVVSLWARLDGGHGLRYRELHTPSPAEAGDAGVSRGE